MSIASTLSLLYTKLMFQYDNWPPVKLSLQEEKKNTEAKECICLSGNLKHILFGYYYLWSLQDT